MDDNPIGFGIGLDGKPHITINVPGPVDIAIGYDGDVSPAIDCGPVDLIIRDGNPDEPSKTYATTRTHDWKHRGPRSRKLETIVGLAVGAAAAYACDRYLGSPLTELSFYGPTIADYIVRFLGDGVVGGVLGSTAYFATEDLKR